MRLPTSKQNRYFNLSSWFRFFSSFFLILSLNHNVRAENSSSRVKRALNSIFPDQQNAESILKSQHGSKNWTQNWTQNLDKSKLDLTGFQNKLDSWLKLNEIIYRPNSRITRDLTPNAYDSALPKWLVIQLKSSGFSNEDYALILEIEHDITTIASSFMDSEKEVEISSFAKILTLSGQVVGETSNLGKLLGTGGQLVYGNDSFPINSMIHDGMAVYTESIGVVNSVMNDGDWFYYIESSPMGEMVQIGMDFFEDSFQELFHSEDFLAQILAGSKAGDVYLTSDFGKIMDQNSAVPTDVETNSEIGWSLVSEASRVLLDSDINLTEKFLYLLEGSIESEALNQFLTVYSEFWNVYNIAIDPLQYNIELADELEQVYEIVQQTDAGLIPCSKINQANQLISSFRENNELPLKISFGYEHIQAQQKFFMEFYKLDELLKESDVTIVDLKNLEKSVLDMVTYFNDNQASYAEAVLSSLNAIISKFGGDNCAMVQAQLNTYIEKFDDHTFGFHVTNVLKKSGISSEHHSAVTEVAKRMKRQVTIPNLSEEETLEAFVRTVLIIVGIDYRVFFFKCQI